MASLETFSEALGAVLRRNAATSQPHHILCRVSRAVQAINASMRLRQSLLGLRTMRIRRVMAACNMARA